MINYLKQSAVSEPQALPLMWNDVIRAGGVAESVESDTRTPPRSKVESMKCTLLAIGAVGSLAGSGVIGQSPATGPYTIALDATVGKYDLRLSSVNESLAPYWHADLGNQMHALTRHLERATSAIERLTHRVESLERTSSRSVHVEGSLSLAVPRSDVVAAAASSPDGLALADVLDHAIALHLQTPEIRAAALKGIKDPSFAVRVTASDALAALFPDDAREHLPAMIESAANDRERKQLQDAARAARL